jgi:hypothetical protein
MASQKKRACIEDGEREVALQNLAVVSTYSECRLAFWNITVMLEQAKQEPEVCKAILDPLESVDAFMAMGSTEKYRELSQASIQIMLSRYSPTFIEAVGMLWTLTQQPNILLYLPSLSGLRHQVTRGVLPKPAQPLDYRDEKSMDIAVGRALFDRTIVLIKSSYLLADGLPRSWMTYFNTPPPGSFLNYPCQSSLTLVLPQDSVPILLQSGWCPERILQHYLRWPSRQTPVCRGVASYATVIRHQDLNAIKAVASKLPDLKPPRNAIDFVGAVLGFKSDLANDCINFLLERYPDEITIAFNERDRGRYSGRLIMMMLKRGANPFRVGTSAELITKWETWKTPLEKFYLPLFNRWKPEKEKHRFLPQPFHQSVHCFLLINRRFKREKRSWLPKVLVHFIITIVASGVLMDMEQPRILLGKTKPQLLEMCREYDPLTYPLDGLPESTVATLIKFRESGLEYRQLVKDKLIRLLSPIISHVLWWRIPLLTPNERSKTYEMLCNDDKTRGRHIVSFCLKNNLPAVRRLLPPLPAATEKWITKVTTQNLLAHSVFVGDEVATAVLLQAGEVWGLPHKALFWLAQSDKAIRCAMLVLKRMPRQVGLWVEAVGNRCNAFALALMKEDLCNHFWEIVDRDFPFEVLSFVIQSLSYSNSWCNNLREFYRRRCEAEVLAETPQREDMYVKLKALDSGISSRASKDEMLQYLTERRLERIIESGGLLQHSPSQCFTFMIDQAFYKRLDPNIRAED